ncbi:hypothetical protein [Sphingomonas phage Kimi]|nr:hypothetical protein [Sphingomonas phage Kimi]
MSLRKTFKTNKTAEIEGVEIPVGINDHNNEPIVIKISRMSTTNKRYTKELNRVTKPHQSAIQNDAMDNELARKMLMEVFVDTILLGWSNLPKSELTGNDKDKDELEFTRDNALALFAEMPDLYDDWEKRAQSAAAFRDAEKEASAKN